METIRRYSIFTDVSNDMTIAREEIFGPVLAVIRSQDTDEAIRIANDTEYDLSGRLDRRAYPLLLSTPPQKSDTVITMEG